MIKIPNIQDVKNSLISKWCQILAPNQISKEEVEKFCEEQAEKTNKDVIWFMPYIPFN